MVTFCGVLQAPIQAALRPAMWLPLIKNLHSYKEIWKSGRSSDDIMESIERALGKVIEADTIGTHYEIRKTNEDNTFIQIFAFTRAEWLDVMEFTINGNCIEARSFSTGLCPLIVPLAIVFNCVFFWVPFYDHKFNKNRIQALREAMDIVVETKNYGSI